MTNYCNWKVKDGLIPTYPTLLLVLTRGMKTAQQNLSPNQVTIRPKKPSVIFLNKCQILDWCHCSWQQDPILFEFEEFWIFRLWSAVKWIEVRCRCGCIFGGQHCQHQHTIIIFSEIFKIGSTSNYRPILYPIQSHDHIDPIIGHLWGVLKFCCAVKRIGFVRGKS